MLIPTLRGATVAMVLLLSCLLPAAHSRSESECASCPLDGTPVCGREDGILFPNDCVAQCQGLTTADYGPCGGTGPDGSSEGGAIPQSVSSPSNTSDSQQGGATFVASSYPLHEALRVTTGTVDYRVMSAMAGNGYRYVGLYETMEGSPPPNAGIALAEDFSTRSDSPRHGLGVTVTFDEYGSAGNVYMETLRPENATGPAVGSMPGWFPTAASAADTAPSGLVSGPAPPPMADSVSDVGSGTGAGRRMLKTQAGLLPTRRQPESQQTLDALAPRLRRMLGVIGADSRVPDLRTTVPNPAIFRIVFGVTGPRSACTAFLIHPSVLLTNGHCVYDTEGRFFYTPSVYRIMQKLNPDPMAEPTILDVRVKEVRTTQGWMFSRDFRYDMGLVFLDQRLGDTHGWFGVSYACERTQYQLTVVGYPGDQPSGVPYSSTCAVQHDTCSVSELLHDCDTYAGQSGSPMFTADDNVARAIHSCEMSGEPYNCGVMFRPDVWDFLLQVYQSTV